MAANDSELLFVLQETEDGDGTVAFLIQQMSAEKPSIKRLHMIVRDHSKKETLDLFHDFCTQFGPNLTHFKVDCHTERVPFYLLINPFEFENLTVLDLGHDLNPSLDLVTLERFAYISRKIEDLSVVCEGRALSGLNKFSKTLKKLSIHLVTPWYLNQEGLDKWAQDNVYPYLLEGFSSKETHWSLTSLSIKARRIRIPWKKLRLSSVNSLYIENGLYGELGSDFRNAMNLTDLTVVYYGTTFPDEEADGIGFIARTSLKLERVLLRIPSGMTNRPLMNRLLARLAQGFPQTSFRAVNYYGEGVEDESGPQIVEDIDLMEQQPNVEEAMNHCDDDFINNSEPMMMSGIDEPEKSVIEGVHFKENGLVIERRLSIKEEGSIKSTAHESGISSASSMSDDIITHVVDDSVEFNLPDHHVNHPSTIESTPLKYTELTRVNPAEFNAPFSPHNQRDFSYRDFLMMATGDNTVPSTGDGTVVHESPAEYETSRPRLRYLSILSSSPSFSEALKVPRSDYLTIPPPKQTK